VINKEVSHSYRGHREEGPLQLVWDQTTVNHVTDFTSSGEQLHGVCVCEWSGAFIVEGNNTGNRSGAFIVEGKKTEVCVWGFFVEGNTTGNGFGAFIVEGKKTGVCGAFIVE